ncbi:MAG: PTS sugar transporter subunit IIA [Legionellaceae bacterium]|nr:PTS sugar transporter subunit IIA [Legionellaceae bacterium]
MIFHKLLDKDSILIDTVAQSKAAVLQNMCKLLSQCHPELNAHTLFHAYWERENLGSTTIGHGVMIPHIRVDSIDRTYGCFLRLQHPVDFGAEDKQPIDLVFGLTVAANDANEHLKTLSNIVRQFSDPKFRSECRQAIDQISLSTILTQQ